MLSTLGEMAPETFEMQFALVVGFAFAWEILFLVLRAIALTFFAGASQDDKKKHRQKIIHVVHCVTNMIHTSIVGPTATWVLFKAPAIRTITYAILIMPICTNIHQTIIRKSNCHLIYVRSCRTLCGRHSL